MSIPKQQAKFKHILSTIPKKPGVYRYYSRTKELLYIGKAKNLFNRVNSYFQEKRIQNQRTYIMVNQIDSIEYTVVKTEEEALLLEANLIHSLQPRFNILLKDEKNYNYVTFDYSTAIPHISIERKKTSPKYIYYGPFLNYRIIYEILRTIRLIFPYCEKKVSDGGPCTYVHVKLCSGVCAGKESIESYTNRIRLIEKLFQGEPEIVIQELENNIRKAIETEQFELAAYWRDRKELLQSVLNKHFVKQTMVLPQPEDLDIITLVTSQDTQGSSVSAACIQHIRNGKLVDIKNLLLTGTETGEEEISYTNQEAISRLMMSYYSFRNQKKVPVLLQTYHSRLPAV
jgi:excinuclease ABC subunit C